MDGYLYVTSPLGLVGPRIFQLVRADGYQQHYYVPPYQVGPELPVEDIVWRLVVSSGVRRVGWISAWETGRVGTGLVWLPWAEWDWKLVSHTRQLGRHRLWLWIKSYPKAKALFGRYTVVDWSFRVLYHLLKHGPDWGLFRPYPLAYFLVYLEWCVRCYPQRFARYAHLLREPPAWFRLTYGDVKIPRPAQPALANVWNPFDPPAAQALDPDQQQRLAP